MNFRISAYYKDLDEYVRSTKVYALSGVCKRLDEGAEEAVALIDRQTGAGKKLLFIGNGASAMIASHQAVDYWWRGGMKAMAFNDPAMLTCVSNDSGFENVFSAPLKTYAEKGDILFAISSSGKSKNIISAVKTAKRKGCRVITLTGFSGKNPLMKLGDINFFVPAPAYSQVEVIHHSICHFLLEMLIGRKGRNSRR